MKNVNIKVSKDSILTITVDLRQEYGLSKSGKSMIIGTTEGNISLPDPNSDVKIGLNIYKSINPVEV